MKLKKYSLLFFIIIFSSFIYAQKNNNKVFQHTFQWKPEIGMNGCDATVNFKFNYYLENDRPWVAVSYNIEKGNTVYFEGNQYSRAELGEEAYSSIRLQFPRFVVDLYEGNTFITSIGFDSKGDMIYGGHWLNIFEGHIFAEHTSQNYPSGEKAKEIFLGNSFTIKNMRLTYLDAVNFHLVQMYALDTNKNDNKNETSSNSISDSSQSKTNSNNNTNQNSQSNNSNSQSEMSAASNYYQNALSRQKVYEQSLQTAATQLVDIGLSIASDIQQARIRNVNLKNSQINEYLNEMILLDKECAALYTGDYERFLVIEQELRKYENLATANLNWLIEKEGGANYKTLKTEILSNQKKRLKQILEHNTAQLLKNTKNIKDADLINECRDIYINELKDFLGDLATSNGYYNYNKYGLTRYSSFKYWRNFVDEERKERVRKIFELNKTKIILNEGYDVIFYVNNNYDHDYLNQKTLNYFSGASLKSKQLILDYTLSSRYYIEEMKRDKLNLKNDGHLRLLLGDGSEQIYYYEVDVSTNNKEKKIPLYKYLNDGDYGYKDTKANELVKEWVKRDEKLSGKNKKDLYEESNFIKENKEKYNSLMSKFQIYYGKGDNINALETLNEASLLEPDNVDLFYNIGVIEYEMGNLEAAITYYTKVTELNPKYTNAYINIAVIILSREQVIIEEMNSLSDTSTDTLRWDFLDEQRHQIHNEVIPVLKEIINLDPENYSSILTLGDIYLESANFKTREANKNLKDTVKWKVVFHERIKFLNEAMTCFKTALKIDNSNEGLKEQIPNLQATIDQANSVISEKN